MSLIADYIDYLWLPLILIVGFILNLLHEVILPSIYRCEINQMSKTLRLISRNPLIILWCALFGAYVIQQCGIMRTLIDGTNQFYSWVIPAYWVWALIVALYVGYVCKDN